MPYVSNEHGETKYVPSIYAKEELCTWSEIYDEFWLGKIFSYDPNNPEHQSPDLYWKTPHRLMILGTVCNQLNKMIWEDETKKIHGYVEEIEVHWKVRPTLVRFSLGPAHDYDGNVFDQYPLIYTHIIPGTEKRSEFSGETPSLNLTVFLEGDPISLYCNVMWDDDEGNKYFKLDAVDDGSYGYKIVEELIKPVIEYFEGDYVGWKGPEFEGKQTKSGLCGDEKKG